jgi:hypothetical protein
VIFANFAWYSRPLHESGVFGRLGAVLPCCEHVVLAFHEGGPASVARPPARWFCLSAGDDVHGNDRVELRGKIPVYLRHAGQANT